MVQNVNLYDPALRIARDWLGARTLAVALGASTAAVALAAAAAHWSVARLAAPARDVAATLQAQQQAAQQLARQIDGLRPDARLVAEVATTQSTLAQRQAALRMVQAGALGRERGHAAALQAFARQWVEGLWLTGVALERDDMALRGRAVDPALIPAYVGRLNREPALQGRAFRTLDIRRPAPAASAGAATPALARYVDFALAGSLGTVVDPREAR